MGAAAMTPLGIILMVVQGLVFLVWAVLMFRALFGMLGRFRAATGRAWMGPFSAIAAFRAFLTDAETRGERRLLGLVTLVLVAATLALAFLRS